MPGSWISHPVLWHSNRTPSGYNYTAMTPEQIVLLKSKWRFVCLPCYSPPSIAHPRWLCVFQWYQADYDYARTTVYFFCVGIFLFGLINLIFHLRQRER